MSLLNSHGDRLFRLLVRLTLRQDVAEDLLQDLVLKLAGSPGFAAAENPYAYARKAALNLAFNWIRSWQRHREEPVESVDAPADVPPAWKRLVKAEDIRRVLEHMEGLRDRDRVILVMRYFDDAAYADIAQVIGSTAGQARALCHKAIRRLRVLMGAHDSSVLDARAEVNP
jgi:RNA polymerase sigma factor (sigma-70 family)